MQRTSLHHVRYDVLTAIAIKCTVLWDVAPCSLVEFSVCCWLLVAYFVHCSRRYVLKFLRNVGKLLQAIRHHIPKSCTRHYTEDDDQVDQNAWQFRLGYWLNWERVLVVFLGNFKLMSVAYNETALHHILTHLNPLTIYHLPSSLNARKLVHLKSAVE
jgi:hypothetical protein